MELHHHNFDFENRPSPPALKGTAALVFLQLACRPAERSSVVVSRGASSGALSVVRRMGERSRAVRSRSVTSTAMNEQREDYAHREDAERVQRARVC